MKLHDFLLLFLSGTSGALLMLGPHNMRDHILGVGLFAAAFFVAAGIVAEIVLTRKAKK